MSTSLEAKSPLLDATRFSTQASHPSSLTTDLSSTEQRRASLLDNRGTAFIWRNAAIDQTTGWGLTGTTFQTSATITNAPVLGSNSDWKLIDSGDFNNDGSVEFLWRNPVSDQITIWGIDGTRYEDSITLTGAPSLGSNSPWTLLGAVNLDNQLTLVWRNQQTDQASIWRFNDKGEYQSAANLTNTPLLGANSNWKVVDVNAAGNRLEFVWRNPVSDQTSIWFFNGTQYDSATTLGAAPGLGSNSPWEIAKSEDIDGDGNRDLIWQNRGSGQQATWFLNQDFQYQTSQIVTGPRPDPNWQIVGVVSVDLSNLYPELQAPTPSINSPATETLIWRNGTTDQITTWGLDTTNQAAGYVTNGVVQGFPLGNNSPWQLIDAIERPDGGTQYLWRNQTTDQTALWNVQNGQFVSGPVIQNAPVLGSNSPWRLVANVFLNSADTTLVWRNQVTDQTTLWTVRNNVFIGSSTIENAPVLGSNSTWELVDAANSFGHLDLAWRNQVTDQTSFWTIDTRSQTLFSQSGAVQNVPFTEAGTIQNAPTLGTNSPWRLVKTEDVNDDSSEDLVWQNFESGQQAVWYLNGYNYLAGPVVSNGPRPNANWRIVGVV